MSGKDFYNLIYKRAYHAAGSEPETPEFLIRVLSEEFLAWKKNPSSVALVEVVDTLEVFISTNKTHTGKLMRPNYDQLRDAFGTTNFEQIFNFMSEHGKLHACGKRGDLKGRQKGVFIQGSIGSKGGASTGIHN